MIDRARTGLIGRDVGAVTTDGERNPSEIAVARLGRIAKDVGPGDWETVVFGHAVEQGAGHLRGQVAGLSGSGPELRELEVAVAAAGGCLGRPDAGIEGAVALVHGRVNAEVVTHEETGMARERVLHRDQLV